jgi:hypothetical protein
MSGFERFRGNVQRIRQLTAPIKITDIMVAPFAPKTTGNYLGEFAISGTNTNEAHQGDLKTRIGDHIEHLALMANKEHEKANFTENSGKFTINTGSENNVTRLSTHEFSFYPKDRPLMLDEYRELLGRIRKIAENCHENLHLLLASFPVKWPDNKVYNIVVHVQCGKEPVLSPFAKSVPSSIDALYPNTTNPSFVGTSFYPKVLSGRHGIKLRFKAKASKFDDVVEWITDGTFDKTKSIKALEDTKQALLADKHCPPPTSLISCIDDSILALNTRNLLNTTEKENFIKAMNNFKTTMIEESDRFDDAANLAPPRPYIISNGIATKHYGRLSFQQIIDFIKKCDGDNSQNDKATEVLEITKQIIEQGRIANPDYPVNPKLILIIDNMILKIKGTNVALDNSDITKFESRMDKYNESCQEIYQDNGLQTQRPDIISSGLKSSFGYVPFDEIAQKIESKSKPTNFNKGETLLTELKDNIEDYNNENHHYAPDSANLIAHIDMMLLKYNPPFAPLTNTDFTDLDAKLKQYKVDCETRYSNYVRTIMPQISSQIGKTASYAEENNLDKIAQLIKNNLDQPNLIRSSRNQLDYLRDYLLFSKKERSDGTHALLKTIKNISEKLDNLIFVDQLQKEHKVHKDIDTIIIKSPLQKEDIVQIQQCLKEVQNAISTLKRIYPLENIAINEIEVKISELANIYNAEDINTITLQKKELDAFKEGYDALSVLLNKLPNDYAVQPSDSDKLKLEVEKYNKENLGDKLQNSINDINKLIKENIDFQSEYAHLSRIFAYINYIETLSPECKKAMSAIKDKLDNKQEVDISLIQELKNQITLQNTLIEKMSYWNFPTQTLSQDIIYDTTVQCRTSNSEWWTNTSVCLDELYAIGLRSYLNALAGEPEPPMYGSEMITSDSVGIYQSH